MNLPIEIISYILEYFVYKDITLLISKNITKYFKQYYKKYLHKYFFNHFANSYRRLFRKLNYKNIIFIDETCKITCKHNYGRLIYMFIKTKLCIKDTIIEYNKMFSNENLEDICNYYKLKYSNFDNIIFLFTKDILNNGKIIFNGMLKPIDEYNYIGYLINNIYLNNEIYSTMYEFHDEIPGISFEIMIYDYENYCEKFHELVCRYLKENKDNIEKKYNNIITEVLNEFTD